MLAIVTQRTLATVSDSEIVFPLHHACMIGGGDDINVDNHASEKVDVTEDDGCTADVNAPKLPPKPQPQVG